MILHCNVLHRSDKNDSDMRRWAFLVSYNKADNDPMFDHHHARYTPLQKVSGIQDTCLTTTMLGTLPSKKYVTCKGMFDQHHARYTPLQKVCVT